MKPFALSVLFFAQIAFSKNDLCWTQEENPATKKPYSSQLEWAKDRDSWNKKKSIPSKPAALFKAFKVQKQDSAKANSFGNDKMAHCFVGCRISQVTDFQTGQFAAWMKEHLDLSDCKMETHFETADYDATLIGVKMGQDQLVNCEAVCRPLFIRTKQ